MSSKCPICTKTVYPLEAQIYDNESYHKSCFKCLQCRSVMGIGSVAKIKGDLYCRPCFKKIFTEKGSYASFGAKTLAKNAPVKDLIASGQIDSSLSISEPATPSAKEIEPTTPVSTPVIPTQTTRKPIEAIIAEATAELVGEVETPLCTPKEAEVKSFTKDSDETPFETPAEVSEVEPESDTPDALEEIKEEVVNVDVEVKDDVVNVEIDVKEEENPTVVEVEAPEPVVKQESNPIPVAVTVSADEGEKEKATSLPTSPIAKLTATFSTNSSVGIARINSVTPKCEVCTKSVYPMEIQTYDDCTYHKQCFKCLQCKKVMTQLGSVAKIKGDLYCKPCFKKIFSEKGSYASFGAKTLAKNAPVKDLIASGVSN